MPPGELKVFQSRLAGTKRGRISLQIQSYLKRTNLRVLAHYYRLTPHPAGVTALVVLFLPNGHSGFYLIDDKAAGLKGGVAVQGGDSNPNRHFPQLEMADAVITLGLKDIKPVLRLGQYAVALLFSEFGIGFIFEGGYGLSFIRIPHPALEGYESTGPNIGKRLL